jgi:imidazolonepropionase-like amidohydrolase
MPAPRPLAALRLPLAGMVAGMVASLVLALPARAAATASAAPVAEQGAFHLYKLLHPVGTERYTVVREGESLVTSVQLSLNYLGEDVALGATLRTAPDLTPQRLEVRGQTSTMTDTDDEVVVQGTSAVVRRRGVASERAVPARFFTIGHYGPTTLVQALYRFWSSHGRPERLPILPSGGEVRFVPRGRDTVVAQGREVVLQRFSVEGLVWGRQAVWFDARGNLVATVHADAELDRFEAVREGYTHALPSFVTGALRDGLADLAEVARRVKPQHAGTFAIVGGLLVDGTGRAPVPDSAVLVRGGRIVAAGPRREVVLPADVPVVDARGRTVLPGLWDMHGHYEQAEWPAAALAAGVTTVREAANELQLVTALRDTIREGRALGPRMLLAGVIDGGEHPLGVVTAATPEQARAAVRRYARAGFQQVKVYQSVPPALVPVIATEAHRLGLTVTGHVPTGMDAAQFVEAGADQVNHVGSLSSLLLTREAGKPPAVTPTSENGARLLKLLRERNVAVEPSLSRWEQHGHPRDSPFSTFEPGAAKAPLALREALDATGAPPERRERGETSMRLSREIAGALHRAGVPLVLGTDLVVPGHSMHRELELAVAAGLTPMEALLAATSVPARVMGLLHESGTVEAGKRADLLLVDGNPLEDIRLVRKVAAVVKEGRLFTPGPLWEAAGFTP